MAVPRPTELRIRTPNDFDGERTQTNRFVTELTLYFGMNGDVYDTDEKKIAFALSYMNGGQAGPWKEMKVAEFATAYPTYTNFVVQLKEAFSAADAPGDARAKLKTLRQTGTADEYISQFKTLIAASEITGDTARIDYFIDGLMPKLVERIYGMENVPTTINPGTPLPRALTINGAEERPLSTDPVTSGNRHTNQEEINSLDTPIPEIQTPWI